VEYEEEDEVEYTYDDEEENGAEEELDAEEVKEFERLHMEEDELERLDAEARAAGLALTDYAIDAGRAQLPPRPPPPPSARVQPPPGPRPARMRRNSLLALAPSAPQTRDDGQHAGGGADAPLMSRKASLRILRLRSQARLLRTMTPPPGPSFTRSVIAALIPSPPSSPPPPLVAADETEVVTEPRAAARSSFGSAVGAAESAMEDGSSSSGEELPDAPGGGGALDSAKVDSPRAGGASAAVRGLAKMKRAIRTQRAPAKNAQLLVDAKRMAGGDEAWWSLSAKEKTAALRKARMVAMWLDQAHHGGLDNIKHG
jgi:hypothetical protein